jgi:hypothetical protein
MVHVPIVIALGLMQGRGAGAAADCAMRLASGAARATEAQAAHEVPVKEFNKLFKSAVIRTPYGEDTALRGRLDTGPPASAAAKTTKDVAPQLEALKKGAGEELKKLRGLLG